MQKKNKRPGTLGGYVALMFVAAIIIAVTYGVYRANRYLYWKFGGEDSIAVELLEKRVEQLESYHAKE